MDIFSDILLKPPQPFIGLFLLKYIIVLYNMKANYNI